MDPYIGQIMLFGGTFAPRGWATCDGQLLSIQQNSALFSILGTTYGGDGKTTFALPDLRGRLPMHPGSGPGLSSRKLGQKSGHETQTLAVAQMPAHNHQVNAVTDAGAAASPTGKLLAAGSNIYHRGNAGNTTMEDDMLSPSGGGQPVDVTQPALCVQFVIALQGLYPSRS